VVLLVCLDFEGGLLAAIYKLLHSTYGKIFADYHININKHWQIEQLRSERSRAQWPTEHTWQLASLSIELGHAGTSPRGTHSTFARGPS